MKNTKTQTAEFKPTSAILKRARQVMAGYTFVIQPDGDGSYIGSANELPGVIVDGETPEQCARHLADTLETVIATYLADGVAPPSPTRRERRTEQVNVRFTQSERRMLERESSRQGYRGIGDLIRAEMIRNVQPSSH